MSGNAPDNFDLYRFFAGRYSGPQATPSKPTRQELNKLSDHSLYLVYHSNFGAGPAVFQLTDAREKVIDALISGEPIPEAEHWHPRPGPAVLRGRPFMSDWIATRAGAKLCSDVSAIRAALQKLAGRPFDECAKIVAEALAKVEAKLKAKTNDPYLRGARDALIKVGQEMERIRDST